MTALTAFDTMRRGTRLQCIHVVLGQTIISKSTALYMRTVTFQIATGRTTLHLTHCALQDALSMAYSLP